jgi:arsenate reductase
MTEIYPEIRSFIDKLDLSNLTAARKKKLDKLSAYIKTTLVTDTPIKLNFICTHNSRRSHLCQVWAKTMAAHYGLKVKSYSGGTEATAVYPTIIKTFQNTGFMIDKVSEGSNPTYKLNFTDENYPMTLFSKRYNDRYNPNEAYAAVMTCNDADANCPIIPAATRISLPYVDPKVSDGTADELEIYSERSRQIATEMKYIFSQIK